MTLLQSNYHKKIINKKTFKKSVKSLMLELTLAERYNYQAIRLDSIKSNFFPRCLEIEDKNTMNREICYKIRKSLESMKKLVAKL